MRVVLPAILVIRLRAQLPQFGQTGPFGQSLLSTNAKAASSYRNSGAFRMGLAITESPMPEYLPQERCYVKCNIAISLSELSLFKDLRGPPGPEIILAPLSPCRSAEAMGICAGAHRQCAPRCRRVVQSGSGHSSPPAIAPLSSSSKINFS